MPRSHLNLRLVLTMLPALFAAVSCGATHRPDGNGQTHWLKRCSGSAECGVLSCICGFCSAPCSENSTCDAVSSERALCKPISEVLETMDCTPPALQICAAGCSSDAQCRARNPELRCTAGHCSASTEDALRGGVDAGLMTMAVADAGTLSAGGSIDASSVATAQEEAAATAMNIAGSATAQADAGMPMPEPQGPREVTCQNGSPRSVPSGVSVVASNISEYLWTVSNGVLTWVEEPPLDRPASWEWKVSRSSLDGSMLSTTTLEASDKTFHMSVAHGADVLVTYTEGVDPRIAWLRVVPEQGAALNVANTQGGIYGYPRLDADAAYWIGRDADKLTLWRSPRVPGESKAIGTFDVDPNSTRAHGLIEINDAIYAAFTNAGQSQIVRFRKDGSAPAEKVASLPTAIHAITSDGNELFVLREGELDPLRNPVKSVLARVRANGTVETIALLDEIGDTLAVQGGMAYWLVSHNTSTWNAALWSIPVDASRAPNQVLASPGALLVPHLHAERGDLFLGLACRVDLSASEVTGRVHVLRLAK